MAKKLKQYNVGPVTERSVGLWCILNPLADPFGGPVLPAISAVDACSIACWAAGEGLLERISAHDDDLVPWDPNKPEDDLDENGQIHKTLLEIKNMLDEAGLKQHMITCNIHSDPVFRRGGLANPDRAIRELAALKVRRTLRIGNLLGAEYFTYWVARDGFEVPIIVPWDNVYGWIAGGLNGAVDYIQENNLGNYHGCTIEPKPNEPRGHMFLPTAGHAAGFILSELDDPDFWGVNPELLQHEGMTLLDSLTCIAYLVSLGKLSFLHFGSQIKGQFDNDFPPLVGPEGLKETAYMFWLLEKLGWEGVVEFDCHMLRSEGDPENPIECRKGFLKNCSTGLAIALGLAEKLGRVDISVSSESDADLLATQVMCGLDPDAIEAIATKKAFEETSGI